MSIRSVFRLADEVRDLSPGSVVFHEGQEGHEMYGVISGSVVLSKHGQGIARIGPEGTFGELALIDHSPRSLTASVDEPTQVAVINEQTFLYLVTETPTFALQVMRSMAARMREMDPE